MFLSSGPPQINVDRAAQHLLRELAQSLSPVTEAG